MAKLSRTLLLTAVFGIAAGNVQAQQRDQTSVIDSIGCVEPTEQVEPR